MRKTLTALAALTSTALALPSPQVVDAKNPYSPSNWPLPHNITGDDQAGQNTPTQGWGGVHLHDPSVVLGPDGHYWSFSTHGLVAISRASKQGSLSGYWEIQGSILVNESVIVNAGRADPWAPDVHAANGQFYAYYAVSQFGSQYSSVGVATSKSLKPGTWTDHGAVLTSSPTAATPMNITNAIDGNYFLVGLRSSLVSMGRVLTLIMQDPQTGKEYLTYGSFWSNLWQFELKSGLQNVKVRTSRTMTFSGLVTDMVT